VDVQQQSGDEVLMVRYLLGDLSASESEAIEERSLRDRQYFEELLAVEEELVDDYVRGMLPAERRRQFEQFWLISPERQERVAIAKGLLDTFQAQNRRGPLYRAATTLFTPLFRPARWRLALAATVLVAVIGALWLVPAAIRTDRELAHVRLERDGLQRKQQEVQDELARERTRNEELTGQLRREREQRPVVPEQVEAASPKATVATFVLSAGLTRSRPGQNELVVQSGIVDVRLQIDLPGDVKHFRYRGALRTPEGRDVWSQDVLPDRTQPTVSRVLVIVPSLVLPDGDYVLSLKGFLPSGDVENLPSRVFRVVRH
jgi:anti-sigma-K factor RskA